jgi:putative molybdopterin biosynthesis protein
MLSCLSGSRRRSAGGRCSSVLLSHHDSRSRGLPSPDEATSRFLRACPVAPTRRRLVDVLEACGHVLAHDVHGGWTSPPAEIAATNGFAVRSLEVREADPGHLICLRLMREVSMEKLPPRRLQPFTTMYVAKGCSLPDGCDAVIPIEDVSVAADMTVKVAASIDRGRNVALHEDASGGELLLRAGTRIGPADLGVLAANGSRQLRVVDGPTFALLSVGDGLVGWDDEVVGLDAESEVAQTRASSRIALRFVLEWLGVKVVDGPHVRDDDELEVQLRSALAGCDGVVLAGGCSIDARDATAKAIAALGGPGVVVNGIQMKPGKPTILAAVDRKPIIGLPGNPSAALSAVLTVAARIIELLYGLTRPPYVSAAIADRRIVGRRGWTCFVPIRFACNEDSCRVYPLPQGSSHTPLLSRADGYARVTPDRVLIAAGELVTIYRLPR